MIAIRICKKCGERFDALVPYDKNTLCPSCRPKEELVAAKKLKSADNERLIIGDDPEIREILKMIRG